MTNYAKSLSQRWTFSLGTPIANLKRETPPPPPQQKKERNEMVCLIWRDVPAETLNFGLSQLEPDRFDVHICDYSVITKPNNIMCSKDNSKFVSHIVLNSAPISQVLRWLYKKNYVPRNMTNILAWHFSCIFSFISQEEFLSSHGLDLFTHQIWCYCITVILFSRWKQRILMRKVSTNQASKYLFSSKKG